MDQNNLSLDLLLQETLALSEYLRASPQSFKHEEGGQLSFVDEKDDDYLFDLADSILQEETVEDEIVGHDNLSNELTEQKNQEKIYPEGPGVVYKLDNGFNTFCVRGFSTKNIAASMNELSEEGDSKRPILKMNQDSDLSEIAFFETKTFELAEALKEQIINRRFPHQEDAVCNISDPGFSWWMSETQDAQGRGAGRFEIFFRAHSINRMENCIQLGPIGDAGIAALRMNQAHTLLRSSFPVSEYSCDDKSFSVASIKPEHLGFISFKNIFLHGENSTELENFPDNSMGRTLFYYFHELAIVRKFWIEVKGKLS